jgi:uncharacterized metal-binding protein
MNYRELYNSTDREIMKIAEDSLNPRVDRVEEIIRYAREAGIQRIGIANCTAFNKEADRLEDLLVEEGFEVAKANCKLGRIPFSDLLPDYKGVSCNPAGQASFLADFSAELNIMMGLCLGHDMIFNSKSSAPVTPLIVKDRKLWHNSLDALKGDQ